jgi:hypothetical protein
MTLPAVIEYTALRSPMVKVTRNSVGCPPGRTLDWSSSRNQAQGPYSVVAELP